MSSAWRVGNFELEALASDGPFAWVFRALSRGGPLAIKIARPPRGPDAPRVTVLPPRFEGTVPTFCLAWGSEGYGSVPPDPRALLRAQWEKLSTVRDPALVAVGQFHDDGPFAWYDMEWVEGSTLRTLLRGRPDLPVRLFLNLARALACLEGNPDFGRHGDVKPENVIVRGTEVKLFDPGFEGKLRNARGEETHVVVTTPAYSGGIGTDDRAAFGVICWEAGTGDHPFGPILSHLLGEFLIERAGRGPVSDFFSTLGSRLPRPADHIGSSPRHLAIEQFLYRAMGIDVETDRADPRRLHFTGRPGFRSWAETIAALESLERMGIQRLSPYQCDLG